MTTSKRYTVDQTLQLLEDSYGDFDSGDESDLSDDPEFPYPTGSPYHDSDISSETDSEKSSSEESISSDTNSGRYLHKHFKSRQTFLLL